MKATVKNISKANQGVHTVDGLIYIEPGHQKTSTIHPDHVERTQRSKLLSVEVKAEAAAAPTPPAEPEPLPEPAPEPAPEPVEPPVTPPAEFDPALVDAMTDDELRAHITQRDGRAPHPNTGREKLVAKALGQD